MYVGCLYIFSGESFFFLSSLKLLQGAETKKQNGSKCQEIDVENITQFRKLELLSMGESTVPLLSIKVFWNVISCSLVYRY
jgi:hypothetical protein